MNEQPEFKPPLGQIKFNITNQQIVRQDDFFVVADSLNYLEAAFEFSDDWVQWIMPLGDEFEDAEPQAVPIDKTAVFQIPGYTYNITLVPTGLLTASCMVPHEVLKAGTFTVSVFGGSLITANTASVKVVASGLTPGQPSLPPTPTLQDEINALFRQVEDAIREIPGAVSACNTATIKALSAVETLEKKLEAGDFTPLFTIGTVETGEPGTEAQVTITGTKAELVLNFVIPKGEKGDKGDPGEGPTPTGA